MTKIEQIQDCIDRAIRRESKMNQQAWDAPALMSLAGRHLLNNLGAISIKYLEIGVHVGGGFCSTLCENKLLSATAIDSFASDEAYHSDQAEPKFMANYKRVIQPETIFYFHKSDAFEADLSLIEKDIDFYFYDAGHSRLDQKMALTYYKPVLANEFIYVCDDFNWGEVKEGTFEGIEEGGYEILYYKELSNPPGTDSEDHLNEHFWRGYGVFLLKKKP